MTFDTCTVTDRRLEMVTREIPGSTGRLHSRALRLLPVSTISSDFPLFTLDYYSVPTVQRDQVLLFVIERWPV